jgi:hypothetical protein
MTLATRICVVCSEPFELQPKKPGFANRCPACSSPKPLDPGVGRMADRERRRQLIEASFRDEIATKRLAEANGDVAGAAKCEERIQKLNKLRLPE